MQADKSRNFFLRRGLACGDSRCRDFRRIGDQRRQQGGGAKGEMRIAYGADGLDARAVVEEHAAAAIDLDIDEARHKLAALQLDLPNVVGQVRQRRDTLDHIAINNQTLNRRASSRRRISRRQ